MEGYFSVLLVIGSRESEGAEHIMPACTKYVQKLYAEAKPMNGAKWLFLEIKKPQILNDLMELIGLRLTRKSGTQPKRLTANADPGLSQSAADPSSWTKIMGGACADTDG